MTTLIKNWFDIDRKGLAKLLERRGGPGGGLIYMLFELISNAWDADGVTRVEVSLDPEDGVAKTWITITDDAPDGFADLRHAWTMFAESSRKGSADKRGRFNLGEKLVLAMCEEATIVTTTGGVMFDSRGRTTMKSKRESGSEFSGLVRMTRKQLDEIIEGLKMLLSPTGVETLICGHRLVQRVSKATVLATLPTEVADDEGVLRRSARQTEVHIYDVPEGETAMLYEMGIPVVETGDKWHVNVMQKVPLNMDRDNVTPAFLRQVRTVVVNTMHESLTKDDASATFVNEALADKDVSPAAITKALDLKFGEKRAVYDPSDKEANMNLVSQGYTLIHGSQLTKDQWANVKQHAPQPSAGQLAPTRKALFSADGKDCWVPEDKWTPNMALVVERTISLCEALLGRTVNVAILSDVTLGYAACYGPMSGFTFNLGRLGHRWFETNANADTRDQLHELIIHELGHHFEANHLDEKYHEALCRLGAKLAKIAINAPGLFK